MKQRAASREASQRPDLGEAIFDPESVFASPEDVRDAPGLTRAQKVKILRSWEYDAVELGVAEEEGMRGDNNDLLSRILLALGSLTDDIDVEHVGPTKQHALPG